MIKKLKRTIFTYFAIPLTGLLLLFLFFFVFLQPAQRGAIFDNILASLPIAKNFVNVHYTTHLNVKNIVDANSLKTSFVSVDFLASIRNSEGVNYIAVYPFQVEAGFDLDESSANYTDDLDSSDGGRKISIHLPAPRIVTADLNEKSSVMVVRGGLKGDSEYITRPVRMAFEKQAMQYSLQKGILEKAKENAIAYYNDMLGGLYDQIEVTIEESIKEEVAQINVPAIPLSFTLMKDNFDYEFHKSKDMSPAVATFRKDNSEITVGYTKKWQNSYRDLWKSLNDDSSNKVFLKFIDPVSPIENGVVCEYGKSHEAICYVLKDNNLFYLRHRPQNDESAKMTIADVLYASFNTSVNEKAPEASGYITFVDLIKNAHGQLAGDKYGELQTTANRILKLVPDNKYGQLLSSIAESFNRKSYPSLKGFGEIGLLLQLYQAIKNDQYEKIDRDMRRDVFSYLDNPNNSSFLNDFRSCLLVQKNRIDLPDQEAETYLKSILEDGHFTREIIKKLSSNQFLMALKIHLNKINSKISAIDRADKNLLYCFAKGDAPAWNDSSEANIFYDLTAFNKVYKRGNESAIRELGKIFEQRGININLNQTLVAIVTRGLIIYDYDALVFTKDRLVVVKDFRDDIENINIYKAKYENLNPGNDSLKFENDKYNNKALLTLLTDLHAVTKKSGTGTKWNLLTHLKDQIRSLAIEEIMIPTPI